MSKKMMLLALAVVSAAFFAMPAIASAEEIHLDPSGGGSTGDPFTIEGAGGTLSAEGEPTVTCEGTSGSGTFDNNSTTTGHITLDFTLCHIKVPVFGTTAKCKSETVGGADNTIATTGTFHLITWVDANGKKWPAILVTSEHTIIVCAGISKVTVTGSVIGTITSPACGKSSSEVKVSFTATGNTQDHMEYTGVKYDLQSRTGENAEKTSALVGSSTQKTTGEQTLTCT